MDTKYISFDTWHGGFNNIRQSYELAAAISFITGRTLILPHKIFVDHISSHSDKATFFDIWSVYNKSAFTSNFNCIDYKDVPEYAKYENSQQYFSGICNDITCFGDNGVEWGAGNYLSSKVLSIKNNAENINNSESIININVEDKFIHFPRNLFGYFYELIELTEAQSKEFKKKLKAGLKFKQEFEDKARIIINGDYNAVHLRFGDFNITRSNDTQNLNENLYEIIKNNFETTKPLFIATDETDIAKFDKLKQEYNLVFYKSTDAVEALVVDMLACSNATKFLGSKYSTYTLYVHILRHYKNKLDYSKLGLNYNNENLINARENYNWHTLFTEMY